MSMQFNYVLLCVQSGPLKEFGYNPFSRVAYYVHTEYMLIARAMGILTEIIGKLLQVY